MKKIFLTCVCISWLACFAQQKNTDSLQALLQQHKTEDKGRLTLFNDIAFSLYSTDPGKGLEYSDSAIILAKKLKDSTGLGRAYQNKGINHWAKSEFELSLKYYQYSLKIYEQLQNKSSMASVYISMGLTCKGMANFPLSLDYLLNALTMFEQINDSSGIADALMNTGLVYNNINEYEKALGYFKKSLTIGEALNEKETIANSLSNTATAYKYLNKPAEALECYDQANKIFRELGHKFGMATSLLNIALIEIDREQYDKAWGKLHESEKLLSELGDKDNLALLCYHAVYLYSVADSKLLKQKGIDPSKRNEQLLYWANRGITLANESGSLLRRSQGLRVLSSVYEDRKQYDKALKAFQEYDVLNDSVYNDSKQKAITRTAIEYEFAKTQDSIKAVNEKQHLIAEARIKQQATIRNAVIAGAAIILAAAVLLFFSYKKRRDAQEQQREAEFKVQVTDTEMKALRSQMNPHFIFNSLNSINDYIDKNETSTATAYTTKFARLMRMILENSEQKEVSLRDDLRALELYMQLEALRMKNKFTYEIKIDEAIDPENTMVPPLILQPFVENSIWHGLAKKEGEGKIHIRIRKEGDLINCIVEDNGIGREKSRALKTGIQKEAKQSLGMKITKSRIDILNKIKRSNAGVELTDLTEGFKAEVRLPFELSF